MLVFCTAWKMREIPENKCVIRDLKKNRLVISCPEITHETAAMKLLTRLLP